ncbi:MAG: DNA cytosine methyltransferase [Clostridiales Family XIII bacterium]|jgi:DNA (cytosine-5)-methyltransferase 1|nr:DNA cytosine methyltransferase [Clostridiales Family XIII bacterium]
MGADAQKHNEPSAGGAAVSCAAAGQHQAGGALAAGAASTCAAAGQHPAGGASSTCAAAGQHQAGGAGRLFTAASLFCGAGGLDIGFERAGFKTLWANDFDRDACETHRLWSKADVVCGDISRIGAGDIPCTDVILGGFPCQGFSLSGPRKIDDSRNRLYKEYVRIVSAKRPLAFIGENVKGLLTMAGGAFMDAIVAEFSGCGYDVYCLPVNARDYGVPQDRERVIIAGFRKDLGIRGFALPKCAGRPQTLADALSGLPQAVPGDVCDAPFSPRYMSRNRKRGWGDVSYTIPAMAKQVPLHPGSPDMAKLGKDIWRFGDGGTRRLSYRECAAIQTFPADMEFAGDLTSKYRQIGNAVPVKLAECAAKAVRSALALA